MNLRRFSAGANIESSDASVEFQDLGLQCAQLTAESSETRAGRFREPVVGLIGYDFQQLLDLVARHGEIPLLANNGLTGSDFIAARSLKLAFGK
jgi:hypothetical protein